MKILKQSVFDKWDIEDKSVQTICTSPPYYSLRKYSIPDVIIGGDKDCKHEWGDVIMGGKRKWTPGDLPSKNSMVAINRTENENRPSMDTHFCVHCNAWQGQHGLEPTFKLYLEHCKLWMQEAIRVLRDDGVIFINLADSYASSGGASRHKGYNDPKYPNGRNGEFDEPTAYPQGNVKPKSKLLIPERFAIMCVDELGLILRNHIVWYKPNGMPESCQDRFSKKWESIFMFTKQPKYYFNLDDVREKAPPLNRWGGNKLIAKGKSLWDEGTGHSLYRDRDMQPNDGMKNPGDCWRIPTTPSTDGSHYAKWPEALVKRMILCSTKAGDTVLDCFAGSGTTLRVADELNRTGLGIDLGYRDIQERRLSGIQKELL